MNLKINIFAYELREIFLTISFERYRSIEINRMKKIIKIVGNKCN